MGAQSWVSSQPYLVIAISKALLSIDQCQQRYLVTIFLGIGKAEKNANVFQVPKMGMILLLRLLLQNSIDFTN